MSAGIEKLVPPASPDQANEFVAQSGLVLTSRGHRLGLGSTFEIGIQGFPPLVEPHLHELESGHTSTDKLVIDDWFDDRDRRPDYTDVTFVRREELGSGSWKESRAIYRALPVTAGYTLERHYVFNEHNPAADAERMTLLESVGEGHVSLSGLLQTAIYADKELRRMGMLEVDTLEADQVIALVSSLNGAV